MRRALAVLAVVAVLAGCSRREETAEDENAYVYEPVRLAGACIALVEKPDAARALLVGEEAKSLSDVFLRAGVDCSTRLDGSFDLIVLSCATMSWESCKKVSERLSEGGVLVWALDVANLTFGTLWDRVNEFALPETHVWMPGLTRWVLVGRKQPAKVRLSDMMDVFARDTAFDDFVKARCLGVPSVFASYLGRREDVSPAFRINGSDQPVRPECFYTKDVPEMDWVSVVGVDRDIASRTLSDIRSMLVVRRLAVKGGMEAAAAKDKKSEEAATATFERVLRRNPDELLVHERLDHLRRNAKGFLDIGKVLQAMKCYETMVLIRPDDPVAVHNFGMCLKKIGKLDLAEKILARAKTLQQQKEKE